MAKEKSKKKADEGPPPYVPVMSARKKNTMLAILARNLEAFLHVRQDLTSDKVLAGVGLPGAVVWEAVNRHYDTYHAMPAVREVFECEVQQVVDSHPALTDGDVDDVIALVDLIYDEHLADAPKSQILYDTAVLC